MPARVAVLTPAQCAVIAELTRDGADDLTIAARLHVTKNTVKTHLKRALAATGHANRTALAVDVLRGNVVLKPRDRRYSEQVPS